MRSREIQKFINYYIGSARVEYAAAAGECKKWEIYPDRNKPVCRYVIIEVKPQCWDELLVYRRGLTKPFARIQAGRILPV